MISLSFLEYNGGRGVPLAMSNRKMDFFDFPLFSKLFQDTGQADRGFSAEFSGYLNLSPFPTPAEPMTESLDDRFFGREPTRQRRIGIFLFETIPGL
jgi:hypothetical protein